MVGRYRIMDGDLFGVNARLKEIDDGYFAVYNYRLRRFEVHNSGQRGDTLALIVPYCGLDVRTVDLVRKTRVQNAKKLLEQMERENERITARQAKTAAENALAAAEKRGIAGL